MRQIRFRAKRVDNGRWMHVGSLINFAPEDREGYYFIPSVGKSCDAFTDSDGPINRLDGMAVYQVDSKTIGQFIGEQDSYGHDIYEGDIVQHGEKRYVIRYIDHYARFVGKNKNSIFAVFAFCNCTIIGNIHDNPELMEGFM